MSKKVKVVMTRTDDRFISLSERARISNDAGARIFCSAHMNSFNGSARGIETFIHNDSTASEPIAEDMNNALLDQFDVPNRGVKRANFAVLRGTFRNSLSILTETLFMDNSQDAELFNRSDFLDKAAQAHAKVLLDYANDGETICLDPGHGGHDPGASGHGHREKDLVLLMMLKTRDILEGKTVVKARPTQQATGFASLSQSEKNQEMRVAVEEQGLSFAQFQRLLIATGEKLPRFGADGHPGPETLAAIEAFQVREGISSGSGRFFGRPGPQTVGKLKSIVKYRRILRAPRTGYPTGDDVRQIQRVVGVNVDGVYGPQTASGVRDLQSDLGVQVDGVWGPVTFGASFY